MTGTRALAVASTIGLFAAVAAGCGPDDAPDDAPDGESSQVASITYTSIGSSTPPQFHQEYEIVVEDGEASIRIGTYGTVDGSEEPIGTDTVPVGDEVWSELARASAALPAHAGDDDCTGGTTLLVEVVLEDGSERSTEVYDCGPDGDEAAEQLEDFIDPVLSLFDVDELDPRD